MRREGSAFQGLGTVVLKELSDQMSSIRIFVLQLLVVALAVVSVADGGTYEVRRVFNLVFADGPIPQGAGFLKRGGQRLQFLGQCFFLVLAQLARRRCCIQLRRDRVIPIFWQQSRGVRNHGR